VKKEIQSSAAMREFGAALGAQLTGKETIELVGDVGAGKTTFVKGLARGLGVEEDVQSPSFTISRVYDGHDGIILAHYDFYRLGEAGILSEDLAESLHDDKTVTVIEWSGIVGDALPDDRLRISFMTTTEDRRLLEIDLPESLRGLAL
tara:strand:- start:134 stop:577 length:444 start_codon:yes stop_codon:yes gene_type:complete